MNKNYHSVCHICGKELKCGETRCIGEDGVTRYCVDCYSSISNIKDCCATCYLCGKEIAFGEGYYTATKDSAYILCNGCNQIVEEANKTIKEASKDDVNRPSHYTDGKIEVIDFIEDKKLNFHRGNAIKYIARAGKKHKDKEIEDLQKAIWYLNREINRLQKAE